MSGEQGRAGEWAAAPASTGRSASVTLLRPVTPVCRLPSAVSRVPGDLGPCRGAAPGRELAKKPPACPGPSCPVRSRAVARGGRGQCPFRAQHREGHLLLREVSGLPPAGLGHPRHCPPERECRAQSHAGPRGLHAGSRRASARPIVCPPEPSVSGTRRLPSLRGCPAADPHVPVGGPICRGRSTRTRRAVQQPHR